MMITCRVCHKEVSCSATPEQIKDWQTTNKLIQNAMPNVPPAERELLISGICGECFDAMFNFKEEEEDDPATAEPSLEWKIGHMKEVCNVYRLGGPLWAEDLEIAEAKLEELKKEQDAKRR